MTIVNVLKKRLLNPIIYSARPRICEGIADRARLENWPVQRVNDPFVLELPVPCQFAGDAKFKSIFEEHQPLKFPAQFLLRIPNASVLGGLVKLQTGEFLRESDWRMRYFMESDVSRTRYHRHKTHLDGDCYYLDILFSGNYAHWLADELPRLVGALPFLPAATRFIIIDPITQYKSESLAALGIGSDRIVAVQGHSQVRCERLWYGTAPNDTIWNANILNQIRDAMLRTFNRSSESLPERVFVSRSGARSKRLGNEEELLSLIKSYDFTVITPEKMSLAEQVRIFSGARVVLGAHGAGLSNLLFCPPGAKLLELQDSSFVPRVWFWKWAAMLGCEYYSMTGPVTASTGWLDTTFRIKAELLKECLDYMLASTTSRSDKQWWFGE